MLLSNNSIDFNDVSYILNKEINTIYSGIMENKKIEKYKCRNKKKRHLYDDKNWLINEYLILKKSAPQIARGEGVGHETIRIWLIKHKKFEED